jgi:hypothetical protein
MKNWQAGMPDVEKAKTKKAKSNNAANKVDIIYNITYIISCIGIRRQLLQWGLQ